ncbi:MAG TPA: hypothetical protein VKC60_16480 [Opitutaceae bacterium]|nr:hypothetical protein [Opitutaceae bacterium]
MKILSHLPALARPVWMQRMQSTSDSVSFEESMREVHLRGDRSLRAFIGIHVALAFVLMLVSGFWLVSLTVMIWAAAPFYLCSWMRPG